MAATYNQNLTVNVISGESYFVTFDFERGIYFNMLSVKMCVKRALTWLLLPHAHKLCNLTHDFSPIWPQKPRFGKYEITTKQQYLKIILFSLQIMKKNLIKVSDFVFSFNLGSSWQVHL